LGEQGVGVGDHGLDGEEVFIDKEVVVHDDGVGLCEFVDGLDVIFHGDLAFFLYDVTVSKPVNEE
jgi:hypothetical protein